MAERLFTVAPLSLPFDARLAMPGSKSHANRAIVAACLAGGTTVLKHATPCDDVATLVKNLQLMGFDLTWTDANTGTLTIHGGMPVKPGAATLDCGAAGTTLRFLTSLACITPGEWTVTGSERMRQRPIGDLTDALRALGANIEDTNDCPPLRIRGKNITGGDVTLDAGKSSQFLSSLLLIGSALERGLQITLPSDPASPSYIDLTERVLRDFGVEMKRTPRRYHIEPITPAAPGEYAIEGDWSAVGAFLVLAEITGSRIDALNLSPDSAQGDKALPKAIAALRGAGARTLDARDIPDQVMNLAVLAAHREGETTITGAANLRLKECDRLAVITKELSKTGIVIAERPDGLVISGKSGLRDATLDPHDDHRMAMAFAILGCLHDGIRIRHPECVSKSYPRFFVDLETVTKSSRSIAIVGMRGCGKSNLARQLARRLKLKHVDTDKVFSAEHGDIRAFVEKNSWEAFRVKEADAVEACLRPGFVTALGGGAIETPRVRELLKKHATVIWMQVREKDMVERLKKLNRPALTDMPLEREVPMILKKRTPLYASVADLELPASIPFGGHASYLTRKLRARCSW